MRSVTAGRGISTRALWAGLAPVGAFGVLWLALAHPAGVAAQRRGHPAADPRVAVSVAPNAAASDSPFAYLFALRATAGATPEVVADRRLLSFLVHVEGRRRPVTCRHPEAPRRVPRGRVRRLGGDESSVWRETIDLRMYCWGRALAALSAGARVEVRYGFGRRPSRERWVTRTTAGTGGARGRASMASSLHGPEFTFPALAAPGPESEPSSTEAGDDAAPRVSISMPSIDTTRGASVTFRPRLRATGGAVRVYVRDDLFRFAIRGPLGARTCALRRTPIAPIIDFFSRLRGRRSVGGRLAVALACPDAFMVAGIYEVTPMVDLEYGPGGYDLDDVVTGTFTGEPVLVRIRRGAAGYLEQVPVEGRSAP
ncbi:MAG: hypothetical protein JRH11_20005 [Deltaproteobacteria bacterium]|nr:hypothetical protein [Deltaproteobacteria bacterium]